MLYFIWKRVHISNSVALFPPLAWRNAEVQNLSGWDNISTLQRYQILLADAWETKQTNALSFHASEEHRQLCSIHSAPTTRMDQQFKWRGRMDVYSGNTPSKRKKEKLVWTTRRVEGTYGSACRPEESWAPFIAGKRAEPGAVGKIKTWASPSSPLPGLDMCKRLWPRFHSQNQLHVAALAFCLDSQKYVYWRLNMRLPHDKKKMKLGSKSDKPHSFNTIFQHWRGPGKTATEATQIKIKKKPKLGWNTLFFQELNNAFYEV